MSGGPTRVASRRSRAPSRGRCTRPAPKIRPRTHSTSRPPPRILHRPPRPRARFLLREVHRRDTRRGADPAQRAAMLDRTTNDDGRGFAAGGVAREDSDALAAVAAARRERDVALDRVADLESTTAPLRASVTKLEGKTWSDSTRCDFCAISCGRLTRTPRTPASRSTPSARTLSTRYAGRRTSPCASSPRKMKPSPKS